jgi:hypothetical protein
VRDYHESAVDENRSIFANYLETMPGGAYLTPGNCDADNATATTNDTDTDTDTDQSCGERKEWNPMDPFECGRAREYFGFDKDFVNDKQICRDIGQFQNTRDFEFIDEFLNQGFSSGISPETGEPPLVPPLILTPPVAGKYLYEFGNGKNLGGAPDSRSWLIFVSLYCLFIA